VLIVLMSCSSVNKKRVNVFVFAVLGNLCNINAEIITIIKISIDLFFKRKKQPAISSKAYISNFVLHPEKYTRYNMNIMEIKESIRICFFEENKLINKIGIKASSRVSPNILPLPN